MADTRGSAAQAPEAAAPEGRTGAAAPRPNSAGLPAQTVEAPEGARTVNGPGVSFTEPDIGAQFVRPLPDSPRPAIVALARHCTNRLLGKGQLLPYEYWSFAEAATDDEAEMLCHLKMRRPYTLDAAVKATHIPAVTLEPMLDRLSYTGLLEYNWENPTRTKQWVLPMLVPGSAEFLNMRMGQLAEHPVFAKFFEQASKGPLSRATPMVPPGGAGIGMHVIPVERAIEHENHSVSIEHIKHWLDKYDGKYAASACSCRMSRQVMGEGCGDDYNDWCIAVGDMADYVVETDRGRYIDRDEVYEILQRAEDNGFVHQITNIDGENKIFAICNCNVNVCYALRTSQLFNTPNLSRSAYVAHTDAKSCVACGRCVEVCPAGAVKLGQKLCDRRTHAVPSYPRQELPDAVKWVPRSGARATVTPTASRPTTRARRPARRPARRTWRCRATSSLPPRAATPTRSRSSGAKTRCLRCAGASATAAARTPARAAPSTARWPSTRSRSSWPRPSSTRRPATCRPRCAPRWRATSPSAWPS